MGLVVFCGTTYLSRLWCIVELFTFVQMGRSTDKIEFQVLTRDACEEKDAAAIVRAFECFDAEKCQCFLAEDKDRIVQIILGAFGDMASFNREVAAIFSETDFVSRVSTA